MGPTKVLRRRCVWHSLVERERSPNLTSAFMFSDAQRRHDYTFVHQSYAITIGSNCGCAFAVAGRFVAGLAPSAQHVAIRQPMPVDLHVW